MATCVADDVGVEHTVRNGIDPSLVRAISDMVVDEKGKNVLLIEKEKESQKVEMNGEEEDDLDGEDDFGNVEYKRQLIDPNPVRFQQLVTQLKWRLGEGQVRSYF
jgi:hypothetical protein